MKKLLLSLVILSGTNYTRGMLHRIVRMSKRNFLNSLHKIFTIESRRFFHKAHHHNDLYGSEMCTYEKKIEQLFENQKNAVIEDIKTHCRKIGVIFDIKRDCFYELEVKKENDNITCYVPDQGIWDYYEYLRGRDIGPYQKGTLVGLHNARNFFSQFKKLGITFDGRTDKQDTLLHLAAINGFCYLLDVYLENDSLDLQKCINDKNIDGNTPLHLLAANKDRGYQAYIRKLGLLGAQTDIQNECGDTPLHLAVRANNDRAVEYIVDLGASKQIKNKKGEIPCDYLKNYEYKWLNKEARDIKKLLERTP